MQAKSIRGISVEDIPSALNEHIADGFNNILARAAGGNVEMQNLNSPTVAWY